MRDDGVDEPEIHLDTTGGSDDEAGELGVLRRVSAEGGAVDDEDGGADASRHPVRDRLLARAREARNAPEQASSSSDDLLGSFTDELDRVATRAVPPSSPALAAGQKNLSPNLIALFGTLLGLALLAALFAVLIHVDPRDGSKIVAASPLVAAITTPSLAPSAAPAPPPVKKPERERVPGPWRIETSADPKLRKIDGAIGRNPFLKAIEEAGVPHAQTFRVLKVLKELRDLDHCPPRDKFAALMDRASSRIVAFEYIVSKEEVYQAREGADGFLKSEKLDLHVDRARVQGSIRFDRATLSESIEAGGFESGLVPVLDEALLGHASVSDFKRGDRLRVVAQEVTVLGDFERYAGIEALEVTPAHGDDRPLRIYYFNGSRLHGYYDAAGRAVHEGGWRRPIKGAAVTSHFNPKRMHPILHKIMPHQGTDFGAPMGTPVGAAGPGVVAFIGNGGPTGNLVRIQHAGGIETGYAHLSRFESGLKVGDHVQPLQIIGYVGSTGRSTGPHLHFSAKKDGVFFDAETLKFDSLRTLPDDQRVEFVEERTKLDALLDAIALPPALDEPKPAQAAPSAVASAGVAGEDLGAGDPTPGAEVNGAHAPPPPAPGPVALTPSVALTPPAAPPAQVPGAAPPGKSPSIYLSDQELMKSQSATDDGEVDE